MNREGPDKIRYLDFTWSPIIGCTNGCSYCWARRQAKRQKHNCKKCYDFVPHLHPERLDEPLKKRDPFVIGAVFMGDLFDPAMPDSARDEVFGVMAATAQHTFVVLTKQPAGACRYFDLSTDNREEDIGAEALRLSGGKHSGLVELPLPNLVLGVSITDQKSADRLIPELLECPAATRIVSIEPMLGAVDLLPYLGEGLSCAECGRITHRDDNDVLGAREGNVFCPRCGRESESERVPGLDGVILGGQTGPGARPMHPDWVRKVRDQCAEARVPFDFKQWGEWVPWSGAGYTPKSYRPMDADGIWMQPYSDRSAEWWTPAQIRAASALALAQATTGNSECMSKVPKKRAGRVLDGRTWDVVAWPQQ